jgi:mannosylglycerate hydrolase
MATYHFISHTHWDREWYLPFETFRAMLVRMMDDMMELLDERPEFRAFTLDGQSVLLEDYTTIRPERAKALRTLGKARRLFAGPWYVLPDEFLVSGESLVRNLMIGSSIARDFDMAMEVGYIPDSFGHAAAMPAILRGFGIDNAILYRGFGGEAEHRTSEYRWKAPDGSDVLLVHLHRHGYSGAYFADQTKKEILTRFRSLKRDVDARATTPHRLLLNGGDHHWPDASLPAALDLLRLEFDDEIVHGTLPDFIDAIRDSVTTALPLVEGELRSGYKYAFVMHGGVYSSRMYLKQENRACERLLERYAEPLHAFAVTRGMRPLSHLLRHAWKELLKNHPHDSICGCSVDQAHRDMMTRFAASRAAAQSVVDASLAHLLPRDTGATKDDTQLFFFNPSPQPRSEVVECTVRLYRQDVVVGLNPDVHVADALPPAGGIALLDADGDEVPLQVLGRREDFDITYSEHGYPAQTRVDVFTCLVEARDIPPFGYSGLRIKKRDGLSTFPSEIKARGTTLKNGHVHVNVNANGSLDVMDLSSGRTITGLHLFEDGGDAGDEYTYSPPPRDRIVGSKRGAATVTVVERGPLRGALRITLSLLVPAAVSAAREARSARRVPLDIESIISLEAGSPLVFVTTTVVNRAEDHRLRVLFPTGIRTRTATADSAFCLVERESRGFDPAEYSIEHPPRVAPMLRFVGLGDEGNGFTLFADGLPEYELSSDDKGTLALTLLRCVGLLGADGLITRPGGKGGWHNETPEAQCPGAHRFRYALLLHSPREHEAVNAAVERFHAPLLPIFRKNTSPLPRPGSLLSWSNGTLVPGAVKLSEGGRAVVVRFWNPSDVMQPCAIETHFDHGEVRNARLDETLTSKIKIDVSDIETPARGITTLRMELQRKS